MLFGQMRTAVKNHYGNTSPSSAVSTQIDEFINSAYAEMCRSIHNGPWNRRYYSFPTIAQLTGDADAASGVSVTGGSKTATFGASSRLDRRFIGAVLRVATDSESYLIVDVTSTTTAILEPAYTGAAIGTALSDQAFVLTGLNYRLPPDCTTPYVVKQSQSPVKLTAIWPRTLDAYVPDPALLGQFGDPYQYGLVYGAGLPDFWGSIIQAQVGGTAGNVNVTNGSFTVSAGSATPDFVNAILSTNASAATSVLPGLFIRVGSDDRYYRIRSVASGTSLTIDEPYRGTTGTNLSFVIMPGNAPWLRLYPLPSTVMQIDTEYLASPPPMQSDEEEPRLPFDFHDALLDGALMNLYKYLNNTAFSDRFERAFDAAIVRLRGRSEFSDETVFRYQPTYAGIGSYSDAMLPWGQFPPSIPAP